jgi:hypothetical protein
MPRSLFVFVEGPDDKRFVERVFRPRLKRATYSNLATIEYAQLPDEDVNAFATGFNSSGANFEYLFLVDRDTHADLAACRAFVRGKYRAVQEEKVFMVCAEIESWYFAGITPKRLKELGIRYTGRDTDSLTKERFNALIPSALRNNRVLFLIQILAGFNMSSAKSRNGSFKAFCAASQAVVSRD